MHSGFLISNIKRKSKLIKSNALNHKCGHCGYMTPPDFVISKQHCRDFEKRGHMKWHVSGKNASASSNSANKHNFNVNHLKCSSLSVTIS